MGEELQYPQFKFLTWNREKRVQLALGRWKSKAKSKHVCTGWVCLRTICKYEIISIKGNKKWFDVCQQVRRCLHCWNKLKRLYANKSSFSCATCHTRFSFSDSGQRMPHYLVQQVNENFPGKSWKPLVNPASVLWLSLTGAKGYNRNILLFNFQMP